MADIQMRHSLEAERAILGIGLRGMRSIMGIPSRVTTTDFYSARHQIIWDRIAKIIARGNIPDIVSVAADLRRDGQIAAVGGDLYLMDVCDAVTSDAGLDEYVSILRGAALVRMACDHALRVLRAAKEEEPSAVLDLAAKHSAELALAAVPGGTGSGEPAAVADGILDQSKPPKRIMTGYQFLDDHLKIRPSNLVVIAGTPGTGKTSLALGIAMNVAGPRFKSLSDQQVYSAMREGIPPEEAYSQAGRPVLFSNLEMSLDEMTVSVMSQATGITLDAIEERRLTDEESARCRAAAVAHRIRFLPCQKVSQLQAQARAMKAADGLEMIVVDYLQLMEGSGETRNEQVASISRGLKMLAAELEVPVIALSQLSREAVRAGRPQLHHLRDSGAIEQDANSVILLSRPAETYPNVLVDIAKARRGATCETQAGFAGALARFHDLSSDPLKGRF